MMDSEQLGKSTQEMNGLSSTPKEDKISNGHLNGKVVIAGKVHAHRNSLLTDLMELKHLQTVHNISVALCLLLLLNMVIYYATTPHTFLRDMSILQWGTSGFLLGLLVWTCLNVHALLVFQGFRYWVVFRHRFDQKAVDYFFLFIYSSSVLFAFIVTPLVARTYEIALITSFSLLCEQVRIFMKTYSFVHENVPRAMKYKPEKDGRQLENMCPSLKHYIYFLFAPTLIYRDSYPRTKEIRWDFVFSNLMQFFACIFIEFSILMRYNIDLFSTTGLKQYTLSEAALIVAGSMLLGGLDMLLMFYSILHCWPNLTAELLRFGDRKFYEDWWNSTSFSQYYRKMNTLVYDWLNAYIYTEAKKLGLQRSTAMVLVFIVSALVHEYIIIFSLGFVYPMLFVCYTTIGLLVLFLTKERTTQFWNTFMWGMLFAGWGFLIFQYSLEWYARRNCPRTVEKPLDYFVPRSWTSTCQFLKYS